jgi:hypothetical protein
VEDIPHDKVMEAMRNEVDSRKKRSGKNNEMKYMQALLTWLDKDNILGWLSEDKTQQKTNDYGKDME